MDNKINIKDLQLVYKRIYDLEKRNLPYEYHKLESLYKLENKIILESYELTREDIMRNKLDKYINGVIK